MALVWSYVKQINRFYRIEERDDQEKDKNKKRLVLFAHNEEDARLICMAVNKSGLTAEMFRKPAQQPIKKAS